MFLLFAQNVPHCFRQDGTLRLRHGFGNSLRLCRQSIRLNRGKQGKKRFIRILLRIRNRFCNQLALNFRGALLRFGKSFRHRPRRHFLALCQNLRQRIGLCPGLYFGRFHLRFGQGRNQFGQIVVRLGLRRIIRERASRHPLRQNR